MSASGTDDKSGPILQAEDLGLLLPRNFFDGIFERRWALLRGNENTKQIFQSLWGFGEVLSLADTDGFKAFEFGIPRLDAEPQKLGAGGRAFARDALRRNMTLVQNHVHRKHAAVAQYMRRVTAFFGIVGGMNSYTTPANSVGFSYHFDPSDAFILQVVGSKSWELCERRLPDPLGFGSPTYNQVPAENKEVQACTPVDLHEGDSLYLPVGQIHRATASYGQTIHLTLGLNRQFISGSSLLLNIAEQINPSKETGFTQDAFIGWIHRVASDWQPNKTDTMKPGFASGKGIVTLLDVPRSLVEPCRDKGKKKRKMIPDCGHIGFLRPSILGIVDLEHPLALQAIAPPPPAQLISAYVLEAQELVAMLRSHPSAGSELIRMQVNVQGQPRPVKGDLLPAKVLEGLSSLIGPEPCLRTLVAFRNFFLKQQAEYDEVILRDENVDRNGEDEEEDFDDRLFSAPWQPAASGDRDVAEQRGYTRRDLKSSKVEMEAFGDPSEGVREQFAWVYPEDFDSSNWHLAQKKSHSQVLSEVAGVVEMHEIMNAADFDDREVTRAWEGIDKGPPIVGKTENRYATCCSAATALEHIQCANRTARAGLQGAMDKANPWKVLIVTYATQHVHSFARYSLAVNANWARRFGHSFVVDARDLASGGVDVKNAKVLVKQDWVSRENLTEQWMLWIGADVVLVDFGRDFLQQILRRHITDSQHKPQVEVFITRDPTGRAGNSMSIFNADVILLRRSEWTSRFLQHWWDDPRMKEGRTDQEVLELLYIEDVLGAKARFVLLPPLGLNSETLTIVAGPPSVQPVIHLGGHSDTTRAMLFEKTLDLVCERRDGPDRESKELQEVYLQALWVEVRNPGEGISSGHAHTSTTFGEFQRLAWHLDSRSRSEEAISVQRAALDLARSRLGGRSKDAMQARTALGTSLRVAGRFAESEALHRQALQIVSSLEGPESRDTMTVANNLALTLESLDRSREAEQLYRRSRLALVTALGEHAPSSLAAAYNLANLLAKELSVPAALQEAEELHRGALSGRQQVFGPSSDVVIESEEALAQVLVLRGRPLEAEVLLQSALRSRATRGRLGDHGALQAMSTLAQTRRLQERYDEAAHLFGIAYTSCRDNPELGGPEGHNTLAAASNYAMALQSVKGREKEAEWLHRLAVVGLGRQLGRDHPNARAALQNYEEFKREYGT